MATRAKKPAKKAASKKQQAATSPPRSFWLGAWLDHLEVKADQFADKIGVDRVSIWRYVTGERQPRKGMIATIAAALGIEPADLWHRPDPKPKPKFVDLNKSAEHITDNEDRQRLADFIKNWRP